VSSSATTPGNTNSDDFYDAAPLEPHLLYQGEILSDVPILSMPQPSRWLLLRTWTGKRLDDALDYGAVGNRAKVLDSNQTKLEWAADKSGDFVMAILDKRPVLVLSQNCDLQNNNFFQIAPIFSAAAGNKDLDKLKNGEIFSAFWLKTHAPEIPEESYADLELIQAIHKSYVKRIDPKQHFRLDPTRIQILQRTITRYFGRPNSFDSRSDKVPRTGTYLCVSCFYMDAHITSVSLEEGSDFPDCGACGGTGWVLKGRASLPSLFERVRAFFRFH
jgi:hypothetical protein